MKLVIGLFVLATFALAFWLFVNWFVWAMADFDCGGGYWACRQHLLGEMAVQVGLPVVAWGVCAGALIRQWKKL